MIFSHGLMAGGVMGMPRRTDMVHACYWMPGWRIPGVMTAIGGSLMFASMMLFFLIVVMTVFAGRKGQQGDLPFTATVKPPPTAGWQPRLDRLTYWVRLAGAIDRGVWPLPHRALSAQPC